MSDPDFDSLETSEWVEALHDVVAHDGADRAQELVERVIAEAQRLGAGPEIGLNTPYINTIPPQLEDPFPGQLEVEHALRSLVRWNAMAIVAQANRESSELGGHIASYQSAATLYEVGFNHFWRGPQNGDPGDLVYFQGHSSPGIYARAFVEGRLSEEQLRSFRRETAGGGLPSYPHPWLMSDFWQFPTVSMGLGPLMAIYQARFMKYLEGRGIIAPSDRKVWVFVGDGEMDEPESMGAISLASRERLDNLIFVVNCNLQRLDGPVRGNGKIIQELETNFHGAGWHVLKVIWGSRWDPLLASPQRELLIRRMDEALDGDYQNYKSQDGAYVREHFFGRYPELAELVSGMSDAEIWNLNRGGHDPRKVYAAYAAAVRHKGQPTVILAKTIKGYGLGRAGEARNITHQLKKMDDDALLAFRDRLELDLDDDHARRAELHLPDADSPELTYLRQRRAALGGALPQRKPTAQPIDAPDLSIFKAAIEGTGEREVSTTMAFVRVLAALLRDKELGPRVVPIVPDESRTFGMEGMFRQLGIYSQVGQLYQPEDAEELMFYREDEHGQILQEGINEPGAFSSWIAAATSYANHGVAMLPFYTFYSMFGFQRVGDLAWAAGDSRARGFLLGGTAGRTTLNGEGLQHEDGHSHLLASTIPNCRAYDPAYAYELAVIVHDGIRQMLSEQEDVFYYITVMNENYAHPPLPEGAEEGILRGMHRVLAADEGSGACVRLLGSGTILREALAAAEMLAEHFGLRAEVWSVTSYVELRRDGMECERLAMLHPDDPTPWPYVAHALGDGTEPVVAASDYMRSVAEQIRPFVPARYITLGTDGFGRSDTRAKLRSFFEVDRRHIALAALYALARDGTIPSEWPAMAIERYEIETEGAPPWRR